MQILVILSRLVISAVPLLGGLYVLLLALRVVGKRPGEDPEFDQWHQARGRTGLFFGPLLIFFGLFLATWAILDALAPIPEPSAPVAPDAGEDRPDRGPGMIGGSADSTD